MYLFIPGTRCPREFVEGRGQEDGKTLQMGMIGPGECASRCFGKVTSSTNFAETVAEPLLDHHAGSCGNRDEQGRELHLLVPIRLRRRQLG